MDEKPEQFQGNQNAAPDAPLGGLGIEEREPASTDAYKIMPIVPEKKKSKRLLYVILGILFVVAVCVGVYSTLHSLQSSVVSRAAKQAGSNTTQQTSATATPVNTQEATIDANLSDIDSTIKQAASDQAQADTMMSDSEQQITVPTE